MLLNNEITFTESGLVYVRMYLWQAVPDFLTFTTLTKIYFFQRENHKNKSVPQEQDTFHNIKVPVKTVLITNHEQSFCLLIWTNRPESQHIQL